MHTRAHPHTHTHTSPFPQPRGPDGKGLKEVTIVPYKRPSPKMTRVAAVHGGEGNIVLADVEK